LIFRILFSFCNLVFAFIFFWSDILSFTFVKSGISTFLQLLQFSIFVLSLQLFWYFFFSSISAIWYLRSISIKKFWSDVLSSASVKSGISTFLQLLQFGISVLSL
jgi:xanthine/uracil permease